MKLLLKNKKGVKNRLLKYRLLLNGCWDWTGSKDSDGYGRLGIENKCYKVSRLSLYIFKNFDIKSRLQALHVQNCKLKSCFNSEHLYVGEHIDNMQDLVKTKTHGNIKKTHCINGHEFTKENTMLDRGARQCRICKRQRTAKSKS